MDQIGGIERLADTPVNALGREAVSPDRQSRPGCDSGGDELRKVYLEITTACDMDCAMCIRHVWRESRRTMTDATFAAIVGQLRRIPSVATVQFGGFGEPTTHPHFLDFLLAAKEAGLRAELVTNGASLSDDLIEHFLDLELDQLIVSLDRARGSGNGPLHEQPDMVQANLRRLFRGKLLRGAEKPKVAIEFVATAANVEELVELKRLGQGLGFEQIVVTNLVPYTRELSDQILYQHWTAARGNVKPSTWNPAIDLPRLDAWSAAGRVVERLQRAGSNLAILGSALGGEGIRCRFVTEGRAAIDPDGNLSPCLALLHSYEYYFRGQKRRMREYHVGNVNQTPLAELWRDPGYQRFRQRVRRWEFSPCIDCGGCELRESNESDCFGNDFPCCGECLWAAGIVQCL